MTPATAPASMGQFNKNSGLMSQKNSKPAEIRTSNIRAAKALSDAIRTSLGPRGMDKMIQDAKGEVTITNDGATILDQMRVIHPAAKMLVELSKAQDVEAGDGTTSVVVMAGSLMEAAEKLLKKGIHPTAISEAFQKAAAESVRILESIAKPVDLGDKDKLLQSANTSLNSKVVSQHSSELSPIAVDAVLKVIDPERDNNVNLKDIKVIQKLGGTVDDTEMVNGLVFQEKAAGNVKKVDKAKIGLIQFQVSPPKTDMDNQVTNLTQIHNRSDLYYILLSQQIPEFDTRSYISCCKISKKVLFSTFRLLCQTTLQWTESLEKSVPTFWTL